MNGESKNAYAGHTSARTFQPEEICLNDKTRNVECTAKRARPASQASGQAPDRPRRPLGRPLCVPKADRAAKQQLESGGSRMRTCEPSPRLITGASLHE